MPGPGPCCPARCAVLARRPVTARAAAGGSQQVTQTAAPGRSARGGIPAAGDSRAPHRAQGGRRAVRGRAGPGTAAGGQGEAAPERDKTGLEGERERVYTQEETRRVHGAATERWPAEQGREDEPWKRVSQQQEPGTAGKNKAPHQRPAPGERTGDADDSPEQRQEPAWRREAERITRNGGDNRTPAGN